MTDHPCKQCGGRGSLTGYTAGFYAGKQFAAFETYRDNIAASERAVAGEADRVDPAPPVAVPVR